MHVVHRGLILLTVGFIKVSRVTLHLPYAIMFLY